MTRLPILAEALRGPLPQAESRHAGAIAVVDGKGTPVAEVGDTDQSFPLRSTTKPFQLLPYLLDGLHRTHPRGLEELHADLAVMMASHAGEPMHVARVKCILDAYGISPQQLLCGAHWPYSTSARDALVSAGLKPDSLHSNCSGKHTGMLAVCVRRGWPLESYIDQSHPLQKRIHDIVADLSLTPATRLAHSVDGCSLPTPWVSLRGLARMYAGLAYPEGAPLVEKKSIAEELGLLFTAGTRRPEMVAGTGRFDTRVMQSYGGRVFAKGGAAGMYALCVAPNDDFPTGLGVAFKVEDGDGNGRVRPVVACEILNQLGIAPDPGAVDSLKTLADSAILNVRGMNVGAYETTFKLR